MAGRFTVKAVFEAVNKVTAPVSRMQNSVLKFTRSAEAGFRSLNKTVNKFGGGVKRAAATAGKTLGVGLGLLAAGVGLVVREFSKVENAEAAFTPLLGGAEKAKLAVEALNKTAASTPFQFETLASATNTLLPVMNGNIENTIKTLRMLGDTAGGNAQKLDSITRGFTKAMLKGKVDMESLNMIAEAGVPIFGDLAEVMGTEVNDSFFKMISAGKVTTAQLTKAFEKLTGKGGKFFSGMDIASKTTTGMFSTLKDNISLTAAEIGSVLSPVVKDLLKNSIKVAGKVREWVKQNKKLISSKFIDFVESAKTSIKKLFSAIKKLGKSGDLLEGLKKGFEFVSDFFVFVSENRKTIMFVVGAIVALVTILKIFIGVMTVVNLVMAMNPFGLVVLGVVALIAVIASVITWWDELKATFLGFSDVTKTIIAGLLLLSGPIGWLIGAAALIAGNWEPLKAFFVDLWADIVGIFDAAISKITVVIDTVKGAVGAVKGAISSVGDFGKGKIEALGSAGLKFLGLGDDEDEDSPETPGPQIVTPQERVARSVEEKRSTSTAEVTIKDESGRAEVTKGTLGTGLQLQSSGAFL